MSDETDKKLPAPRPTDNRAPSVFIPKPTSTGGVVDTWVTGWRAKQKAAAHTELAALNRAKADEIDAYGELATSYERTARIVRRLDDLPDTLALDAAKAQAERESDYAKIERVREERNARVEYDHAEGGHRTWLDYLRRQREIEEAEAKIVEAQRQKFTVEQGFENQRRLKDRNLKIFATRAEAEHLNAEVKAAKVRGELRGGDTPAIKQSTRDALRTKAEETLIEAMADGNDAEVERWQRVLDALEER